MPMARLLLRTKRVLEKYLQRFIQRPPVTCRGRLGFYSGGFVDGEKKAVVVENIGGFSRQGSRERSIEKYLHLLPGLNRMRGAAHPATAGMHTPQFNDAPHQ